MSEASVRTGNLYQLPGNYAVVEQIDSCTRVVTFQTRTELQEYLDEIAGQELDDDEENWEAPE